MKILFTIIAVLVSIISTKAQITHDTVRNMPNNTELTINQYTGGTNWGYWTGHNHLGRQQFGEKYYVNGEAKIIGVVSHLAGTVSPVSTDSSAFNIWTVGSNRFPFSLIGSEVIKNKDLIVTGEPLVISFKTPVTVRDSFIVALDLFDYSHHTLTDTIGLMYGTNGSRSSNDNFGRNVIQVHSHGTPVWRDFGTQNFTNIRTHLAIYPIIEIEKANGINKSQTNEKNNTLSLYPNPCREHLNLNYSLRKSSEVTVSIIDFNGQLIFTKLYSGPYKEFDQILNIQNLFHGDYILLLHSDEGNIASKFTVIK